MSLIQKEMAANVWRVETVQDHYSRIAAIAYTHHAQGDDTELNQAMTDGAGWTPAICSRKLRSACQRS